MKLIICHQTKNPCYIKAERMTPKGIVVHSTGANNPNLKRYVDCEAELGKNQYGNHWNQGSAQKMVHAFIGKDKNGNVTVVNTLPYDMACVGVWAAAAKAVTTMTPPVIFSSRCVRTA